MLNHYTITFGMRQAFCKMSVSMSGDHKVKIDKTGGIFYNKCGKIKGRSGLCRK